MSILVQGCGRGGPEIDKIVLAKDPSFGQTIEKRNSLRREIETKRAEFLKKDAAAEIAISDLKHRRVKLKREYVQKEEKIKHQLDPEKRQLERDIRVLEREFKRKNEEIQEVDRDIKEINSLIKKKEVLSLTPEEIRTWNSRVSVLVKKKDKVMEEEKKLKEELEITKLKVKVLEI
ncbi:MAG: hypothetical protein P9L90_02590 [Candidatus Aadella gelida]|nr:hypothetical protein [Candidatus Aadella gelida]